MEGICSDGSEESKYQFRYARLMRYLYPSSARLDDSPLFNLAYNDTCSFTWTGPKHIRQDIFECRTCGLMDSLCCCSECARVCHKGHDCRLKRTSPTAYCDCWEKCRCRSLISGHQDIRKDLFKRLLDYTDMVYLPNRLNDHLLVYLARRVVRQWKEQKQFKSMRRHGGGGGERNRSGAGEPEHDLDPPVFSRQALEIALDSKAAVASLLCDCNEHLNGDCGVRIARFVRSVARIYTGLMLSLAPDHNKKKS
ncbi:unnamed protein product [Rodentolepis nana]|uniref:UBR-type domain-containing protein n=1 Tax=Rodentolepis nana TaxID=102285 RepID=A0A0R3T8M4_RODNA|nr:unnamed protein product [Rodentolepis nana]